MAPKVPPRVVGQIEYFTSPYEQKLFADLFDSKLMMTKFSRHMRNMRPVVPGLIIFAGVYTWGNATHHKLSMESRY